MGLCDCVEEWRRTVARYLEDSVCEVLSRIALNLIKATRQVRGRQAVVVISLAVHLA